MRHATHEHANREPSRPAGGAGRPGGHRRRTRQASAAGHDRQAGGAAQGTEPGNVDQAAQAEQAEQVRFRQLPYVLVLFGVLVALATIWQGVHVVRSGTLVLAGVLLIAALARLALPEQRAGMLSSRRRFLDVAIFGVLGIGLLVAGLVVPVPG